MRVENGYYMDWGFKKLLERLYFGESTDKNNDKLRMALGFFWSEDRDMDSMLRHVTRKREFPIISGQFPDIDPYKTLYELADSEDHNDFWRELEQCVQNRTKAS